MLTQQYQRLRLHSKDNLKRHVLQIVPVLSIFALLGALSLLINPNILNSNNRVYAWVTGSLGGGDSSSDTNIATDVTASLIIDSGIIKDNIVAARNDTAYVSHNVHVVASDIESYSLTITGPTKLTGASNITGADGKTGSNLNNNTWGYAWGDKNATEATMTYNSFTGTAQPLTGDSVSSNQVDFERKLAFAAKFGQDATEGHYTASISLNLVATPSQVVLNPFGIEYMQDMTSAICQSAPEHTTFQLKDSRDGKTYWVTKMKDGNCWMTQNLDWDGESGSINGTCNQNYYDVGEYVLKSSLPVSTPCTVSNAENLANCVDIVNVKDKTSSSDANFSTSHATSVDGNTYDAHYLIGNYYSFNYVAADSSSVCPKNWWIPPYDTGVNGSYNSLFSSYGITTSASNGTYDIRKAPFYITYAGYESTTVGSITNLGNAVRYAAYGASGIQSRWATPCGSTAGGNIFQLDNTAISYTDTYSWYPTSVRCVFINE